MMDKDPSLLYPNQIIYYGIETNDFPHKWNNDDTKSHLKLVQGNLNGMSDDLCIPLMMNNIMSVIDTFAPTQDKLDIFTHIVIAL